MSKHAVRDISPNLAVEQEQHEVLGENFLLHMVQPKDGKCFHIDENGQLLIRLSKRTAGKLATTLLQLGSKKPRRAS